MEEYKSQKIVRESVITNTDNKEKKSTLEHRYNPITNSFSTICLDLKEKWENFVGVYDIEYIKKLYSDSKTWCPFCKDLQKITPTCPQYCTNNDGRWCKNDVFVFPNLFPRMEFEAVVTNSNNHDLFIDSLDEKFFFDHISISIEAINDVYLNSDNRIDEFILAMNFLPPAGASLLHPHCQISMRDFPFAKSLNSNVICSEDCDRFIKKIGKLKLFTPYSPLHFNEIWGEFDKEINIQNLCNQDIQDLSFCLSKILKFYFSKKCSSFNFIIFGDNINIKKTRKTNLKFIICSRPNFKPNYLSIDSFFLPLFGETILPETPESIAKEVIDFFNN